MTIATLGALGIVVSFACVIVSGGLDGAAAEDGSAFVVFSAGPSVKLFFWFLFGKHILLELMQPH